MNLPSRTKHLQKTLYPNHHLWDLEFQHMKLGEAQTFRPQQLSLQICHNLENICQLYIYIQSLPDVHSFIYLPTTYMYVQKYTKIYSLITIKYFQVDCSIFSTAFRSLYSVSSVKSNQLKV